MNLLMQAKHDELSNTLSVILQHFCNVQLKNRSGRGGGALILNIIIGI